MACYNEKSMALTARHKAFLAVYKELYCNRYRTAKQVGWSHPDVCRDIRNNEEFAAAVAEVEGEAIHEAETTLREMAMGKNITALIYLLKNRHPNFKEEQAKPADINVQLGVVLLPPVSSTPYEGTTSALPTPSWPPAVQLE